MSLKYMGVPDRCRHGEYTDKLCDKCEIERLRGENAECRRLLREACDKRYLDDEGQECAYVTSRWLAAAKAGGSDE